MFFNNYLQHMEKKNPYQISFVYFVLENFKMLGYEKKMKCKILEKEKIVEGLKH